MVLVHLLSGIFSIITYKIKKMIFLSDVSQLYGHPMKPKIFCFSGLLGLGQLTTDRAIFREMQSISLIMFKSDET